MKISDKFVETSLVLMFSNLNIEHHHEDYNVDLLNIMAKFDKAFQNAETNKIDIISALEITDKIEKDRQK